MVSAWIRQRSWFVCKLAVLCLLAVALSGFGGLAQPAPPNLDPQTVGRVTNLTATTAGQPPGTVRLTWTEAENAQVHFVAYIKATDVSTRNYGAVRVASFAGGEGVIEGLEGGTPYVFTAIGMRWNWIQFGEVWGDWSEWEFATPTGQRPTMPTTQSPTTEPSIVGPVTDVTVRNIGGPFGVQVAWSPARNAQIHFVVYIESADRAARNFGATRMQPFVGSEGIITGLGSAEGYDFIVIGMRWNWINFGTVWGNWSPWVSAGTPVGPPVPEPSDSVDRSALVALYNATNGSNWVTNTNWIGNRPLGEWHGVTTDANGRVTEIALARNRLSGEIPRDLGQLTNLTSLVLADNRLSGEIPPELGNLPNLVRVYLSNNLLIGCVPDGLRYVPFNDLSHVGLPFCGEAPTSGPDLVITSLQTAGLRYSATYEGSVEVGSEFSLFVTVHNQGGGRVENLVLRHYRDGNEIGTEDLGPLTESVRSERGSFVITAPTQPGIYQHWSCVDTVPGETDTTNNCSSAVTVSVTVASSPDLVVRSVSVSNPTPDLGEEFRLNATVYNQGNRATNRRTNLNYYRSSDRTIDTRDTWVGTDRVAVLDPGDEDAESIDIRAPSDAGTYYYGACVERLIEESNIANNCSTEYAPVTVSGRPDLVVRTPRVDTTRPATGSTIEVTFPIGNQGDSDSGRFRATAYRSRDRSIGSSDERIRTLDIGNIEAGKTLDWRIINVEVPTTAGTYYYGACVSAVSNESNTRNNCSTGKAITAVAPSDLVVGISLAGRGTEFVGAPSSVTAMVSNQGRGSAGSSARVRFYRSENRSFSNSQIGLRSIAPPSPSRSVNQTLNYTVPNYGSDITTVYYAACVDRVADESNSTNNCSDWIESVAYYPLDVINYSCSLGRNFLGVPNSVKIEGLVQARRDMRSAALRWKAIDSFGRELDDRTVQFGGMSMSDFEEFDDSTNQWALFDRCDVTVEWRY